MCPTLCNSMDYSLPGPSIHGIFQARVLEWVASGLFWFFPRGKGKKVFILLGIFQTHLQSFYSFKIDTYPLENFENNLKTSKEKRKKNCPYFRRYHYHFLHLSDIFPCIFSHKSEVILYILFCNLLLKNNTIVQTSLLIKTHLNNFNS